MKDKLSQIVLNDVILDSMPGIAYIFTKDGLLIAWNKRTEDILGYSKDELQNKFVLDFIDETYQENVLKEVQNVFSKGYSQVEYEIVTKTDKRIHCLGTGAVAEIDGKEYMIGLAQDITELNTAREKIKSQVEEITRLNEQLRAENIYLKDKLELTGERSDIIGGSDALKYILYRIEQVAPTDASVLIEGETGTGKELFANAIHNQSKRKDKPFITVNCASIPENLIESELFGHEKGAFTCAIERRIGRFELANGGTIFLDEIGELSFALQPKLLHVLQKGEFERIGSSKTIETDVRVIAATNKDLESEIKKGHFRKDLFYRLHVFPLSITPLRERKSDILSLVEHFTKFYSEKYGKAIKLIPKKSIKQFQEYSWPGNIRELENVIERAVITSTNNNLNVEILIKDFAETTKDETLEQHERSHIINALEKTYWKISGSRGAASILNINPETLRSKMRKLGINRYI
jgi:PAS domain S-box-containing protein